MHPHGDTKLQRIRPQLDSRHCKHLDALTRSQRRGQSKIGRADLERVHSTPIAERDIDKTRSRNLRVVHATPWTSRNSAPYVSTRPADAHAAGRAECARGGREQEAGALGPSRPLLTMQMRDMLSLYSGLVERCFTACSNDMTTKVLTAKESTWSVSLVSPAHGSASTPARPNSSPFRAASACASRRPTRARRSR